MAVPHFYPNIQDLFAMCGHNQSISFEISLSHLATIPGTVIRKEFTFHQTYEEEWGWNILRMSHPDPKS